MPFHFKQLFLTKRLKNEIARSSYIEYLPSRVLRVIKNEMYLNSFFRTPVL